MPSYLIVTDSVPRLSQSDDAGLAWGIARGLLSRKHSVVVLTLAPPDAVSRVPGLARRLRKVEAQLGEERRSLSLFEGRFSASDPQLLVVEGEPTDDTSLLALWLGAVANALSREGLLTTDAAIGWGESAALALAQVPAGSKFFVVPDGHARAKLTKEQASDAGLADGEERALAAIGANAAHALIAPSQAAARSLAAEPALANRASDEPIVALRFGCDDPPHDPATDPALPVHFSAETPGAKAECRRALVRRLSLACGPRTLLYRVAPLRHGEGGDEAVQALEGAVHLDALALVPTAGDRDLVERARVLSIEYPTRVALVDESTLADSRDRQAGARLVTAAADAVLLPDPKDLRGRAAGVALRYGAVPIAPAGSAAGDLLIDIDRASVTGNAVLYAQSSGSPVRGAIARLCTIRQDPSLWPSLSRSLLTAAPTWTRTAESIDHLREEAERGLDKAHAVP